MSFFGKQNYRKGGSAGGLSPWIVIAGCVVLAVVLTVIVGNILKVSLDDEAYRRATEGKGTETTEESFDVYLPEIELQPFTLGDSTRGLTGRGISVFLSDASGNLTYSSPVALHQGRTVNASVSLTDQLERLGLLSSYVSGIYYPQCFAEADPAVFYAVMNEECALLREFLLLGGSEVVLSGVPCTGEIREDVITYVGEVKRAARGSAVGVAVSLTVAESENGWEFLARLLQVCDFCVLDLSGENVQNDEAATVMFNRANFFLTKYDMRLMLSRRQTVLLGEVRARGVVNLQLLD